jgi:hypothetical protein
MNKAIAENKNAIVASCWTYFTTMSWVENVVWRNETLPVFPQLEYISNTESEGTWKVAGMDIRQNFLLQRHVFEFDEPGDHPV